MKPLIVITVFNRARETRETLQALEATTDLNEVEIVIVDNHSIDGASETVDEWVARHLAKKIRVLHLKTNIGCPRALNLALAARKAGQAVVKLDNDVRITTPGWVDAIRSLIAERFVQGRPMAMIGAQYDGALDMRLMGQETFSGMPLYHVRPIIGHAVWHTGAFMDLVGCFDVLAEDHLYGFEDLILSHKASRIAWDTLVWDGWQIENLQRRNSLGSERNTHVEAMRPLYERRVNELTRSESLLTGSDGLPVTQTNRGG